MILLSSQVNLLEIKWDQKNITMANFCSSESRLFTPCILGIMSKAFFSDIIYLLRRRTDPKKIRLLGSGRQNTVEKSHIRAVDLYKVF